MRSARLACLVVASAIALSSAAAASDELADCFRNPPADARPQTWWHWMNGNISREGITADLEAMNRIGLGGAQIFNAAQGEEPGPVKLFSPEWYSLVKHAVSEGNRLGLEITMHNCAGWSESGGPWVTPAQAMQRVVWSELRLQGPTLLSVQLPEPTLVVANYRADIAVLAFPSSPAEADPVTDNAGVTSSTAGVDVRPLLAGDGGALVELPLPSESHPQVISVTFRKPRRVGSVRLVGREYLAMPVTGHIEGSADGVTFRELGELPNLVKGRNHPSMLATFPEATIRQLRIVITKVDTRAKALLLSAIEVGGVRLPHTEERAGFRADARLSFLDAEVPADEVIAADRIVDLTSRVKDGRLEWKVPAGSWTIVRFCSTPTGQMNAPAPDGGRGWECDKMSREAVDAHFSAMIGRVIDEVGPLAGKTFTGVLADSWEAGSQNWTPAFRSEFQRRRGYDPQPYLPVLMGRVVSSTEVSQRFLWDYRRTIGDLIAENHYAEFRRLAHRHGMKFWAEAPGIGMPTIADELECKGRTDVPMGEFWMDGRNDSKEAAVAAHVYGAKYAAAEAFTAKTEDAKWMKSPYDHKSIGDLQFTLGINEYVFHRYAHQPWLDRFPGMSMGRWGTNFERTNTWWEQGRAWIQYITRCQYLLQQGLPFSDVCYFYGEDVPNTLARNEPDLPPGYDYDACNAEVLLNRMSVRDGRLVLPNGVSYRLLVLQDTTRMTPEVLSKVRDLVAAGATVVGRRPALSPSLAGYPKCDDDVRRMGAELWGDGKGMDAGEHAFGHGRVLGGMTAADALAALKLSPDFSAAGPGRFGAIHRRIGDADVYFVSSQNPTAQTAVLSFRISGRAPELWHPDTGMIEREARFTESGGRTTIPLSFDPAGSVFVVFRGASGGLNPVVALKRGEADVVGGTEVVFDQNNHPVLTAAESGKYTVERRDGQSRNVDIAIPSAVSVDGAWSVTFPAGWGAPAEVVFPKLMSWTESAEDGVRYFSGTATYRKEFDVPVATVRGGGPVWLDLGAVKEIAEVKLNGHDLGILWKPPFRVDVTPALQPGRNSLEVRVTNLWPNRMIGDRKLPEAQRHTWSTFNPFTADTPLLPSGLLGPVRIVPEATVTVD